MLLQQTKLTKTVLLENTPLCNDVCIIIDNYLFPCAFPEEKREQYTKEEKANEKWLEKITRRYCQHHYYCHDKNGVFHLKNGLKINHRMKQTTNLDISLYSAYYCNRNNCWYIPVKTCEFS